MYAYIRSKQRHTYTSIIRRTATLRGEEGGIRFDGRRRHWGSQGRAFTLADLVTHALRVSEYCVNVPEPASHVTDNFPAS